MLAVGGEISRALGVLALGFSGIGMLAPTVSAQSANSVSELRGVWITNVDSDVLSSRARIAETMDWLAAHHFNVVFPVVWNKGYTLYDSELVGRTFGARIDPIYVGRDPLAEVVIEAHRVGIEVIPWFEYGFAAGYEAQAQRLFEKKPEWVARDKDGKILEKNSFQWFDALNPEVQAFAEGMMLEVAKNYDVDGVQGDDRLPALPSIGGYDAKAIAAFKKATGRDAPADPFEPKWLEFRAGLLTEFLAKLRSDLRALDGQLVLSMSPSPYDWGFKEYLQDSKTWVERKLVDVVHPQCYRRGVAAYQASIDEQIGSLGKTAGVVLAPGILVKVGNYRIPKDELLACIAHNRKKKVQGEVFFFLEGLRENNDELGAALLAGPYAQTARAPYRTVAPWRPRAIEVAFDAEFAIGDWVSMKDSDHRWQVTSPGVASQRYEADIAVGATYDVYLDVPDAKDLPAKFTRSITIDGGAPDTLSTAVVAGDMRLAKLRLESGAHVKIQIESAPEPNKHLALGRLWFSVDRKKSPKALFK